MTHTTHKKGTALEMSLGLLLWGHFNEFKTAWKLLQLYKGEEEKETSPWRRLLFLVLVNVKTPSLNSIVFLYGIMMCVIS